MRLHLLLAKVVASSRGAATLSTAVGPIWQSCFGK